MMPSNHKTWCVSGIGNLLKRNYKIDPDLIDLEAKVNSKLSFRENWENIKQEVVLPIVSNRKFVGITEQELWQKTQHERKDECERIIKVIKTWRAYQKGIITDEDLNDLRNSE